MSDDIDLILGFLKYEGKKVNEGFMDARQSAQALLGLDEAIRYLTIKQVPSLKNVDFDLPVKIRRGSWEILIPDAIELIMKVAGAAYTAKAAQKMADKDFNDIGFKDIIKKSIAGLVWFVKLGKHCRSASSQNSNKLRYDQKKDQVIVVNDEDSELEIPRDIYELIQKSNDKLLKKVADLIESDKNLKIGVKDKDEIVEEVITTRDKFIFGSDDVEEEVLFPELEHGKQVELIGSLTKGNERSNNLGLWYKGHVLTCTPKTGRIVRYKECLFTECRVTGYISREDKGEVSARKPKVIFTHIQQIGDERPSLFD